MSDDGAAGGSAGVGPARGAAARRASVRVRTARPGDIPALVRISHALYPAEGAWNEAELRSHQRVFPEGQLVAVDAETGEVLGLAASLIILWEDYDIHGSWWEFTGNGLFTNHDPVNGHTLYGAGVMVKPDAQGRGVGSALYEARRELATRLGLSRIRSGARLPGYHRHAQRMSAQEYVDRVVAGELDDPNINFQLKHGFRVLKVVPHYLPEDPESLGYAAVLEWLNPAVGPA